MTEDRRVYWVHRPTKPVERRKWEKWTNWNPNWNHHALFVETVRPDGSSEYTVFELELDDNGKIIRPPRDRKTTTMDGWRGVRMTFTPFDDGPHIQGITSYPDQRIREFGKTAMDSIDVYDVTMNKCKNFAASLFVTACDVEASKRAKYLDFSLKTDVALTGGHGKSVLKFVGAAAGLLAATAALGAAAYERRKK